MSDLGPLVVIDGVRTPFSRAGTALAEMSAADLGTHVVKALLAKTGLDPARVAEVIFGCVCQPFDSANVARVIGLRSGLPEGTPASTVHRNCASGFEAVTTAAERFYTGRGELFVVGGTESMSNVPLLFPPSSAEKFQMLQRAKNPVQQARACAQFRPTDFAPKVGLLLGLTDPTVAMNMGETAELLATEFGISRERQDALAHESHCRAAQAREALAAEITPVYPSNGSALTQDDGVREQSSTAKLGELKPAFVKPTGTVTAGNSSQVTDGAVALLVGSERLANELGLQPLGRLVDWAYTGCDPARMGLGPVTALAELSRRTGRSLDSADVVEINEAFAAQVLAVLEALKSDERARQTGLERALGELTTEQINRQGGAIAMGHPVGATGARLVLTALKQLEAGAGRQAIASACVGGGQGAALWLEAL